MCTIYWEFICFVLFFGQISIRVHCICFFFLQKLQHDFPKYQGLCSFSCLVFVCLPLFCYLINQSSYVIIKVEITRLLLLFNFNGICLHYDWLHSSKINGSKIYMVISCSFEILHRLKCHLWLIW